MWLQLNVFLLLCVHFCHGGFTFCHTSSPDADQCLAKAIENALRLLETDVSEYGLKKIEPYSFPKLTFDAGSGAVHFVQHYKNIDLFGYSAGLVKSAHFDKKNKVLNWAFTIPRVIQKANYSLDGQLLALPVIGNGISTFTFDNFEITNTMKFEEYQKEGDTYFKIKSNSVTMMPQKMIANFENLFNGNKLLGDNVNKLLNDEWELFYNDTKPSVEHGYSEVFKKYADVFFNNVPSKKIFPN